MSVPLGSTPLPEMMTSVALDCVETSNSELFTYNKHNESIFDDVRYFPTLDAEHESIVKFDDNNPTYINRATLRALIVQMTSPEVIDYNLICDFFLTYRTFSDSQTVMKLLLIRLVWALQYINSGDEETEKIGKLVLLRTFVVLRHWIINYFYDDFEPDEKLCDLFALHINTITENSHFITAEKIYELKIITDLKVHYFSQANEFFAQSYSLDDKQEVYNIPLPLHAEMKDKVRLKKSNTDTSIHTNPSFRRLAMLSLYDLKVHHKCLVFDTPRNSDENPQLSIQNLICHHKSSRLSLNDKLKDFKILKALKVERQMTKSTKLNPLGPKNNYMNIKNSSLTLKKTAQLKNSLPISRKQSNLDAGFSTNGNIKLPTCRVLSIVPCSPIKKMEIELRDESLSSPRKGAQGMSNSLFKVDSVGRKDSFKKVVDGWKKSFHHDSKTDSPFIYPDTHNSPNLKPPQTTDTDGDHGDANEVIRSSQIKARSDILSARIIDELEFLIRCYVTETGSSHDTAMKRATVAYSRLSKQNTNSFQRSASASGLLNSRESKSEAHLQNILEKHNHSISFHEETRNDQLNHVEQNFLSRISSSDINRDSKHSLSQSRDSSFNGRVTSIDWNDEDLKFENSGEITGEITGRDITFLKTQTPGYDSSINDFLMKNRSSQSSGYRSSELDKMNDDIHDLSIALSPLSMKKKPILSRVSHYEDQGLRHTSRFSINLIQSAQRRESFKSYLTYDSALSLPLEGHEEYFVSAGLKKKVGCHDLKKMLNVTAFPDLIGDIFESTQVGLDNGETGVYKSALVENFLENPIQNPSDNAVNVGNKQNSLRRLSIVSHRSRASSIRRSARFSTLCALTELPFNCYDSSTISLPRNPQLRLSDLVTENSIFSQTTSIRNNLFLEECVSFDASSTASVSVPGINTHVLKELAAIPDESFSARNPIRSALYKLEGKNGLDSKTNTSFASHDSVINVTNEYIEADRSSRMQSLQVVKETDPITFDEESKRILEEIENAETEDAIEYSSDIEEALAKPITPIRPRQEAMHLSLSASNVNSLLLGTAAENRVSSTLLNPKSVLEKYSIMNELLTVRSIMELGTHVPFVLSYSSQAIAEHFTIIEKDLLQEIDWKELIELRWNKDLTPVNSWLEIIANDNYYNNNKGVNLVIARFNLMVNWIISEILLTKNEAERINVISRFIHTAYHCFVMQNFATLMQIILALTSERLNKLRSTWNKLPPGDILTLKNLEKLASPVKNFYNIRLRTNEIIPSRGCIPFVGLYLSDLVFNAERPKFVKVAKNTQTTHNKYTQALTGGNDYSYATEGDLSYESEEGGEDRLINFSRFRTSVHIVKSLSQSIEWAGQYDFSMDDELLRKCLYIKSLDEDEMKLCVEIQVGGANKSNDCRVN